MNKKTINSFFAPLFSIIGISQLTNIGIGELRKLSVRNPTLTQEYLTKGLLYLLTAILIALLWYFICHKPSKEKIKGGIPPKREYYYRINE